MSTLAQLIDAFMASDSPADIGSHGRLAFWREQLGHLEATAITPDDVDDVIVELARRGKLIAGRNITVTPSGKPLAPATLTRYQTTLSGIYRWARRHRLIPRNTPSPTQSLEKPTSPIDRNKFLTPEQVEKLLIAAAVTDKTWGRLTALIVLGFHTGLRLGSLKSLRWRDIDFDRAVATIARTKNGDPHIAPLTARCLSELNKLRKGLPDDLVFAGRTNRPYCHTKLWQHTVELAGLQGVTFHWLRHSCGAHLATSGVNQASIMAIMGHKTLTASARYMHANINDRERIVREVFQ